MLATARGKIKRLCWQTSLAIRRELESCAKANLGVVKINLTEGRVVTAAAVKPNGGGEQVNGRERETAALLSKLSVKPKLVRSGFAPRHLRRSTLRGESETYSLAKLFFLL